MEKTIVINGFLPDGLELLAKRFNALVKRRHLMRKLPKLKKDANESDCVDFRSTTRLILADILSFLGSGWSCSMFPIKGRLYYSETLFKGPIIYPEKDIAVQAIEDIVEAFNDKMKIYGLKTRLQKIKPV